MIMGFMSSAYHSARLQWQVGRIVLQTCLQRVLGRIWETGPHRVHHIACHDMTSTTDHWFCGDRYELLAFSALPFLLLVAFVRKDLRHFFGMIQSCAASLLKTRQVSSGISINAAQVLTLLCCGVPIGDWRRCSHDVISRQPTCICLYAFTAGSSWPRGQQECPTSF